MAYHHGNLREALVCAALDILERDGLDALSLRGLARVVGVSPMAPYHHFQGRAELLAAVAAEGFRRLQQNKRAVIDSHGADPAAALAEGAAAYVDFMLAHPSLYRLMKSADFADHSAWPELRAAAAAPAMSLVEMVRRHLGDEPAGLEPSRGAQMLWGIAHGIGALALDGQIPREAAAGLARDTAEAVIAGWRTARQRA